MLDNLRDTLEEDDFRIHKPFFWTKEENHVNFHSDDNLFNPYAKAVYVLLSLYSMEFGKPPLYQMLYLAAKTQDMFYLDSLGPFAYALALVTHAAEDYRLADDKILSGYELGYDKALGYFEGVFVAFRGAFMEPKLIEAYRERAQKGKVGLPGYTSTLNLRNALANAFPDEWESQKDEKKPTLFFLSVKN